MKINLKKEVKENRIKSILYLAITFGDFECIQKLLHPKGMYCGLSKGKFMHYLMFKDEFESDEMHKEIEVEYPFRYNEMISLDRFPGQRCFIIQNKRLNDGEPKAYVFLMHPHQKHQVYKIIETKKFKEERHIREDLMERGAYDLICKN